MAEPEKQNFFKPVVDFFKSLDTSGYSKLGDGFKSIGEAAAETGKAVPKIVVGTGAAATGLTAIAIRVGNWCLNRVASLASLPLRAGGSIGKSPLGAAAGGLVAVLGIGYVIKKWRERGNQKARLEALEQANYQLDLEGANLQMDAATSGVGMDPRLNYRNDWVQQTGGMPAGRTGRPSAPVFTQGK